MGLLLLLIGAYVLRRPLLSPLLIRIAESAAQTNLGLTLDIGRVGGSWFDSLVLEHVHTEEAGSTTIVRRIDAERLRVRYSLWGLLRGAEDWLESIEGRDIALELDLSKLPEPTESGEPAPLPAVLPLVELDRLSLSLFDESLEARIPNARLKVHDMPGGRQAAALRFDDGYLRSHGEEAADLDVSLAVEYAGGWIDVRELRINGVEPVRRALADLGALHQDKLTFDLDLDLWNGRLKAEGWYHAGAVRAQLGASDIRPEKLAGYLGLDAEGRFDFDSSLLLYPDDFERSSGSIRLRAEGARLGKVALDRLEADADLQGRTLSCRMLEASGPGTWVRATDCQVPLPDDGRWEEIVREGTGQWQLEVSDLTTWLRETGLMDEAPGYVPDLVRLSGELQEGVLRLDEAAAWGPSGHAFLDGLVVEVPPEGPIASSLQLTVPADLAVLHPEEIPGLDTWEPFVARFETEATLRFDPQGSGALDELLAEIGSLDGRAGDREFRIDSPARFGFDRRSGLTLEGLELRSGMGDLDLSGSVPLDLDADTPWSTGELKLLADLRAVDFDWLGARAPALPEWLRHGVAQGRIEIAGNWREPEIVAVVEGDGLDLSGLYETLPAPPYRAELRASYTSGRLTLEPSRVSTPQATLEGIGEWSLGLDLAAVMSGLAISALGGLDTELRLDTSDLSWLAERQDRLQRTEGQVRLTLSLEGDPRALSIDGWVEAEELALQATGKKLVRAEELRLALRSEVPATGRRHWSVQANAVALHPEGSAPIDLDLDLAQRGRLLTVERVLAKSGATVIDARGRLPLDPSAANPLVDGTLELDAVLEQVRLDQLEQFFESVAADEAPLDEGWVSSELRLRGSWADPRLELDVTGRGVHGPWLESRLPAGPVDLDLVLAWAKGSVAVDAVRLAAPEFEVSGRGRWEVRPRAERAAAGEYFELGPLDGRLALTLPDLAWLDRLDGIRRASGRLQAEFTATGLLADLDLAGALQLRDGALRLETVGVAPLEKMDLEGTFDRRNLLIEKMTGELGAAPFEASGRVAIDGTKPPVLDLRLRGSDLLLYRYQGVKIRADTDLTVSGPLTNLLAEGAVDVTDGRLVRNVGFLTMPFGGPSTPSGPGGIELFSLAPPLDQMRFAVAVTSETGLRLKSNVADGMIRPSLRLEGTGELPILRGELYLDDIDLALPTHNVRVGTGAVRFLEANPFVPELELHASMRRFGYDVTIVVTGPYDDPVVTLSSIPPLPQDQLLLLATTGQRPTERFDTEAALSTVAVYLARDLAALLFDDNSTESEEAILTRLEVETGRDAARGGKETIQGRFLLLRDTLVDGDALYLEGEQDAYGDFNLGLKITFRFR